MRKTYTGHAFAEAAVVDEFGFEGFKLLVEEVVGLVDQADGDVGDGADGASVEEFPIDFVGLRGLFAKAADVE